MPFIFRNFQTISCFNFNYRTNRETSYNECAQNNANVRNGEKQKKDDTTKIFYGASGNHDRIRPLSSPILLSRRILLAIILLIALPPIATFSSPQDEVIIADEEAIRLPVPRQEDKELRSHVISRPALHMSTSSSPVCASPSSMVTDQMIADTITSTYYPCAHIVDYDFYIGDETTIATLNEAALKHLSNPLFNIIPNSCRVSLKRSICTNIYRKCSSTSLSLSEDTDVMKLVTESLPALLASSTPSLLSSSSISTSLPFVRPCRSLCDDVTDTCASLFQIFDTGDSWLDQNVLNCTGRISAAELIDYGVSGYSLSTAEEHLPYIYVQEQYNSTATASELQCNAPSTSFVVSSGKETYAGITVLDSLATGTTSGTWTWAEGQDPVAYASCAGITTSVFIPAEGISPYLTGPGIIGANPLGSPFAYQNATESALRSLFASLPSWLGSNCYTSLRRLLCAALMPAATMSTLQEIVFSSGSSSASNDEKQALWSLLESGINNSSYNLSSYDIVLPSYPDDSLCTDFHAQCGGPVAGLWMQGSLAGTEVEMLQSLLNRSCTEYPSPGSTSVVGQLRLSAATVQYISSTTATATAYVTSEYSTLNLTSPARGTSSTTGGDALSLLKQWGSTCPYGFVVPDDPSHVHNKWVDGTQCAQACRSAYSTPASYEFVDSITIIAPSYGLVLMVLFQFELAAERSAFKRMTSQNLFLTAAGVISAATSIAFLIIKGPGHSTEEVLCLNNAVPYSNGYSSSTTLCSIQSGLLLYLSNALVLTYTGQTTMLFVEAVLQMKGPVVSSIRTTMLFFVFAIPLALVKYVSDAGNLGYQGTGPWCFHSGMDKGYLEPLSIYLYYYYPQITTSTVGWCFMSWSFVFLLRRSLKAVHPQQPDADKAAGVNVQQAGGSSVGGSAGAPAAAAAARGGARGRNSVVPVTGYDGTSPAAADRDETVNEGPPSGDMIPSGGRLTLSGGGLRSGGTGTMASNRIVPLGVVVAVPAKALEQYLFSSIIAFNSGWMFLAVAIMYYPLIFTFSRYQYINQENDWTFCVFQYMYYEQLGLSDDDAWKQACGQTMYKMFNSAFGEAFYCTTIFLLAGQSIIVWTMRMPQRFRKYFGLKTGQKRQQAWMDRMRSVYAKPLESLAGLGRELAVRASASVAPHQSRARSPRRVTAVAAPMRVPVVVPAVAAARGRGGGGSAAAGDGRTSNGDGQGRFASLMGGGVRPANSNNSNSRPLQ